MTRLESGVELRRDGYPLEEIVGAVLQRMERQLRDRSRRPRFRRTCRCCMSTTC